MDNVVSPIKKRASKYVGTYLGIILFIMAFGMGILAGQVLYAKQKSGVVTEASAITQLIVNRSTNNSSSVNFNQFWQVWDRVKEKYVKQGVNETDMFYGAVQGMVASLGDPYSVYMPPADAETFAKDLSGELEGIGAEIGVKNDQLQIITPLPDSPAEKAGLRPGDRILAIDKEITTGMDVNTAVSKIRGKGGTQVVLTIMREGATKTQEITITRAKIIVPSVLFNWKDTNIAYLRIMQFNDDTMPMFNKYVSEIKKNKKLKGLILDLRNNPGGYLESAIAMGSAWVDDGIIVSERGRDSVNKDHYTEGSDHPLSNVKTVVLVNGGSASASEIVAGALQDNSKAKIIGEKTYGKGSVQDFEVLSDGSALKLTVAEWYTPKGKNINKEGITPDVVIKEDWAKEKVGQDSVLTKAISVISGK